MADYISREAAIKATDEIDTWSAGWRYKHIKRLMDITAADVVEVVRCKDCVRARQATGDAVLLCDAWSDEYSTAVREDGYCHLGEKKSNLVEIDQVKEDGR